MRRGRPRRGSPSRLSRRCRVTVTPRRSRWSTSTPTRSRALVERLARRRSACPTTSRRASRSTRPRRSGRAEVASLDPVVLTVESRRARGPEAPAPARARAAPPTCSAGCCSRSATGSTPAFGDAAAPTTTLDARRSASAWDVYCVGRLGRLGHRVAAPAAALPLPQPPRLHRRRRRRLRPRCGTATDLTWADIDRDSSDEAVAAAAVAVAARPSASVRGRGREIGVEQVDRSAGAASRPSQPSAIVDHVGGVEVGPLVPPATSHFSIDDEAVRGAWPTARGRCCGTRRGRG